MNQSSLLGKVSVAFGLLFVVLSMWTFISQAMAGCCGGTPLCSEQLVANGCVPGVCHTGTLCYMCKCDEDFFHSDCVCD